jgi:hypothetical protein
MTGSRPRGILSPADRAYLRGEADLASDQSEYDTRYRIRERVRHALLDFELLFGRLAAQDRQQVFAPAAEEREPFTEALVSAVAFLYLGTGEYDPPRKNLFAEGIRRAAERECGDESAFCSVRIDVERPTRPQLERILHRVETGAYHELGEDELRALACLLHRKEREETDLLRELKAALDDDDRE